MKRSQTIINGGFLLALALFFLLGLGRTVFRPKEINSYENTTADRLHRPTVETVLDSSFQESVEEAFSDQVPFSELYKKVYNTANSKLLLKILSGYLAGKPECYVHMRNMNIYAGDYLVYTPSLLQDNEVRQNSLNTKIDGLNKLFSAFPDLDFYVYYIERDADVNFETGAKNGVREKLFADLALPAERLGAFQIDGFEEYRRSFYHTDHHWNCYGSYQGYQEVLQLLNVDEPPLQPVEELVLPGYRLSGSKAGTMGASGVFTEEFPAYRFAYPEMKISITGNEEAADYGNQDAYFAGEPASISYGAFYGGDSGEAVFDTGNSEKENILVLGESYDNAILKLLASHFHKTCSVDLRSYERAVGAPFDFTAYVREHDITKVLLIGSDSYFTMPEFLPAFTPEG